MMDEEGFPYEGDDWQRHMAQSLLKGIGVQYAGPNDEMVQHAMVMIDALHTIAAKQQGYRSSWRSVGYLGTLLKVKMKTERLLNLLWYTEDRVPPESVAGEATEDTWMDLLVYAAFGLQQWRWRDARGSRT